MNKKNNLDNLVNESQSEYRSDNRTEYRTTSYAGVYIALGSSFTALGASGADAMLVPAVAFYIAGIIGANSRVSRNRNDQNRD